MSIKKIWGTRTKANAATYVGERGTLFYNELDGELRLSDGVTPGGTAVTVRADLITAQRLLPGADDNITYGLGDETHRWYDLHIGSGGIHFDGNTYPTAQTVPYLPGAIVESLIPYPTDNSLDLGSDTHRWGDLWLGGASLHLEDQSTGDDVSISVVDGVLFFNGASGLKVGPLYFDSNIIKTETVGTDILVGETDDTGIFNVRRKAQFNNTTFSSTEAMVSINGSGGSTPATNFPDTLVQLTSRPNKTSRLIQRAYGVSPDSPFINSYAVWGSYAARGTIDVPLPLQAGDILARVSANGYGKTGGTGVWGSGGTRIESVALENFTATAKGSKINFWTTPVGQLSSQNVAAITADGVLAKAMEFQADVDLSNNKKQTKAGIEWDQKGAVNGIASLDNNGKLTTAQIPDVLTGAIVFKGVWNATTNVPALSDTTPAGLITGWEYIVEVGGTRDIGDGSKVFVNGDFVIFDGTHWKQVPSGNLFTSLNSGGHITVNQTTGTMTLGSDATSSSTNNTIVARDSSGNFAANVITANLTGTVTGSVSGNAGSVTNGVYTNGSYANPAWITSLAASKVGLGNVTNESKATMFTSPTFTGTTSGITATMVGLGSVENTALSTWAGSSNITTVGTLTNLSVTNKITGSISGNADGSAGSVAADNITGTTLASNVVTSSLTALGGMSTIKAGTISAAFTVAKNTPITTQTFTVSGLTTSHKIIITSNTAMPDETYNIAAAWVSATNTVSIQIAHTGGQAFTATFNISYFAWV